MTRHNSKAGLSIEAGLPPVVDDGREYLPDDINADLVLDYLKHPDLCHDLALLCREKGIPIVASRKKTRLEGAITPRPAAARAAWIASVITAGFSESPSSP